MKQLLMLLIALSLGTALSAASTLGWTQPGDTLVNVQAYTYTLTVNAGAPITLVATCVQPVTTNPVTCSAPIATPPVGSDSLILTAKDAFGSTPSAPLVGVMPSAPTGLTVQ